MRVAGFDIFQDKSEESGTTLYPVFLVPNFLSLAEKNKPSNWVLVANFVPESCKYWPVSLEFQCACFVPVCFQVRARARAEEPRRRAEEGEPTKRAEEECRGGVSKGKI